MNEDHTLGKEVVVERTDLGGTIETPARERCFFCGAEMTPSNFCGARCFASREQEKNKTYREG